jgi:predicted XRE-type DNA-binding protein
MNEERDYLDEVIDMRKDEPGMAEEMAAAEMRVRLATLRQGAGLTQRQLAERMGVPQPRVAEIEKHPERVSFGRIEAYVKATGGRIELVSSDA